MADMLRTALLLALLPASALADDGVDRVPEEFPTIQVALDQGSAPVILVGPGEWDGAVVDRPVSLVGRGAVIRSGPLVGFGRVGMALREGASRSEITGFTFDCNSDDLDMGVYASSRRLGPSPDAVSVSRNVFRGCVQGVTNAGSDVAECSPEKVDGGQYWVVQDNVFDGFRTVTDRGARGGGLGVVVVNAEYNDVLDNEFRGWVQDARDFSTSGVALAGCWDCVVAQNRFQVDGGRYYWSAVFNLGYYQQGAAASRSLIISDNDASSDSAPRQVNFQSLDSFDTDWANNLGVTSVDHTWCGDQVKTVDKVVDKPLEKPISKPIRRDVELGSR